MRIQISITLGILFMLGTCAAMSASSCTARVPEQVFPTTWTTQNGARIQDSSQKFFAGYRLRRIAVDPVLHRRWAWMENCSHPEWPPRIIAMPVAARGPRQQNNIPSPNDVPRIERVQRTGNRAIIAKPAIPVSASAVQGARSPSRSFARVGPIIVPPSARYSSSSTAPLVRAGDRVHLWSSEANVRLEVEVIALEYGRSGQVIHLRRKGQQTLLAGVVVGLDSAELMP